MKGKKILFILTFMFALLIPTLTYADGVVVTPDMGSGGGPTGGKCPDCKYLYDKSYRSGYTYSIVDENGARIPGSHSVRYIASGWHNIVGNSSITTKVEGSTGGWSGGSLSASDLPSVLSGLALNPWNANSSTVQNQLYSAMGVVNSKIPVEDLYDPASKISKFLEAFGITVEVLLAECGDKEVFVEAQPNISIKNTNNGVFYFGTPTEIVKYCAEVSGNNCSGIKSVFTTFAHLLTAPGGMAFTDGNTSCEGQYACSTIYTSRYSSLGVGLISLSSLFQDACQTCQMAKASGKYTQAQLCAMYPNDADCCSCAEAKATGEFSKNKLCELFPNDTNCCPQDLPPIETCDYYINTEGSVESAKAKIVTNCATGGNSGVIKDVATWDCVFQSLSSNKLTDRTHYYLDELAGNPYCQVYCMETLEYDFPNAGTTVRAGSWFTLGAYSGYQINGPIKYTGTTKCRTTGANDTKTGQIDLEKFREDWDRLDKAVAVARTNYNSALAYYHSCLAVSTSSCSSCCRSCPKNPDGTGGGCCDLRSGTRYSYKKKDYWKNSWYNQFGYSSNINGQTLSRQKGSCCSACRSCNTSCTHPSDGAYDEAVKARNLALAYLKQCNNFYRTYKEFDPALSGADSLQYNYGKTTSGTLVEKYYTSSWNLVKDIDIESYTRYQSGGTANNGTGTGGIRKSWSVSSGDSDSVKIDQKDLLIGDRNNTIFSADSNGNKESINYTDCDYDWENPKAACTTKTDDYPTNKWLEQTTIKTITYDLPSGIYYYIDLASGESSNSPLSSNYTYLGFSNLPVHYSTPPGSYAITINYSTFGTDNKFNDYIIGTGADSFYRDGSKKYGKDIEYECTYQVLDDPSIICTPGTNDPNCPEEQGGSDLIYRPISLHYPFPGEDGSIRNPGQNWASYWDSSSSTTSLEYLYIKNNRGVADYNVYRLDPMYEIKLTPAVMAIIKEYNKQQKNKTASYYGGQLSGVLGYSDFEMNCENDGEGGMSAKCKSRFLRTTLNGRVAGCGIANSRHIEAGVSYQNGQFNMPMSYTQGSAYNNCGNTVAW